MADDLLATLRGGAALRDIAAVLRHEARMADPGPFADTLAIMARKADGLAAALDAVVPHLAELAGAVPDSQHMANIAARIQRTLLTRPLAGTPSTNLPTEG